VVEFAAAMIDWVRVVIGDAFTTQVVKRALDRSGDDLWTRLVPFVLKRLAFVVSGHCKSDAHANQSANYGSRAS
jgi:hypothetical protein